MGAQVDSNPKFSLSIEAQHPYGKGKGASTVLEGLSLTRERVGVDQGATPARRSGRSPEQAASSPGDKARRSRMAGPRRPQAGSGM